MTLQELLLKIILSIEKDTVTKCPEFIQCCAELHEKNAEFIDSIIMYSLEIFVT